MREVKFRAWYAHDKKMKRAERLMTWDKLVPVQGSTMQYAAVLLQWTGIKDKNGKDIYEGDVIVDHTTRTIWAVTWDEEMCGWGSGEKPSDYCLTGSLSTSMEVIGNIYENPELLNPEPLK